MWDGQDPELEWDDPTAGCMTAEEHAAAVGAYTPEGEDCRPVAAARKFAVAARTSVEVAREVALQPQESVWAWGRDEAVAAEETDYDPATASREA